MNVSNIDDIERTQKYVAKTVQSLPMRTHDEIARGLIGWNTMKSVINCKKIAFLERLIHNYCLTLPKSLLLARIFDFVIRNPDQVSEMKGFVPDVYKAMKEYGLHVHLDTYVRGGTFPDKRQWAGIRKHAIISVEKETWAQNMNIKSDCPLASLVMDESKPHILYKLGKKDISVQLSCASAVRLISIPIKNAAEERYRCGNQFNYIPLHVVMECTYLNPQREALWEAIIDHLDVNHSVNLMERNDLDIMAIMLGAHWEMFHDMGRTCYEEFLKVCSRNIKYMMDAYGYNRLITRTWNSW